MEEILKVFPTVSRWISIPVIIVTSLITWWPKIQEIVERFSAERRSYEREKRKLELLKIRYEIEAIRKSNNIEEFEEKLLESKALSQTEHVNETKVQKAPLPFFIRASYGAAGGLFLILFRFIVLDMGVLSKNLFLENITFYALQVTLVITISGLSSAVIKKDESKPSAYVLLGIMVSFFLSLVITAQVVFHAEYIVSGPEG